jgi:hypothetical protein
MFIKKLDLKVDFIFFCGYEINVGEHRRGNQETLATLGTLHHFWHSIFQCDLLHK